MVWPVEQGHVHSSSVRTVIMYDLIVGVGDFRLADEVLEHVPVLYLADSEYGMIGLVVIRHRPDDGGHVVQFLLVPCLGPFVGPVRQELVVVFPFVMIGVEEVLEVVESEHIAAGSLAARAGRERKKQ